MTATKTLSTLRLAGLYLVIALARQAYHDTRNLVRWARAA